VHLGFADDLMQLRPLHLAEWVFLFVLTGSMIFEMTHFRIISDAGASLLAVNAADLPAQVGISNGLIKIAYLFLLLPSLLWLLPFILMRITGMQVSLKDYLKNLSLIFLPVITSFFIGLVIMEIATKFPYYKYIVHDIKGVETIKAILFRQIPVPQMPYWTEWIFLFILILSLSGGIVYSYRIIRKIRIRFSIAESGNMIYILPFIFIFIILFGAMFFQLIAPLQV
jgi:hypothetical protein